MTSKAYVIVEIGYDYDDNYYHSNGNDGSPIHVFLDEELAEKVCLDKNLKELINLVENDRLFDYLENGIDESEVEAYRKCGFSVSEKKSHGWTDYNIENSPSNISEEQAKELFSKISLQWYRVAEVDATVNPLYRQYLKKT